jgi:uncharacterized membrane protein
MDIFIHDRRTRDMKRIQTFDLLRGLAILAMVIIHRIIWDYYRQHPEAQIFSVGFLILTLSGQKSSKLEKIQSESGVDE